MEFSNDKVAISANNPDLGEAVERGVTPLMGPNPRLGTQLWYRTELGINEPLICLTIARGLRRTARRFESWLKVD